MSNKNEEEIDEPMVQSSDDNDDSMDEDDENEKINKEKVNKLRETLSYNNYDYQTHIDLIDLLKSTGELEELREARNNFSKVYPLSPELWLDWLRDEQKLIGNEEERSKVIQLFDLAMKDYISVDLWVEYGSFMIGNIGTPQGIENARKVFERAVSAVGLDVSKGGLIWDTYREFENAIMGLHKEGDKYVIKLFNRQCVLPLIDMQKTYDEYNAMYPDSALKIKSAFGAAIKKLEIYEPFELALLRYEDEQEKFNEYTKYIETETKSKDSNPVRIQGLYERRITEMCLNPDSWIPYLEYLDKTLKIDTISLPVHERSIRNCPWSGELWVSYLRASERFNVPHKDLVKILEQALNAGFQEPAQYTKVWISYLDYLRRRIKNFNSDDSDDSENIESESSKVALLKKTFNRAIEHVSNIEGSDPECLIARYLANLSADRFRDIESARNLWNDYVFPYHSVKSSFWMEYLNLEKMYGDTKHLRKAYLRAINKTTDWPEVVGSSWIQFEREEGGLDQFEEAERIITAKYKIIKEKREREADEQEKVDKAKQEKIDKKKEKDKNYRREKRREEASERKRKYGVVQDSSFQVEMDSENKKIRTLSPEFKEPLTPSSTSSTSSSIDTKTMDQTSPSGLVKPPPGFKPPLGYKSPAEEKTESGNDNNDEVKKTIQDRTVFLSNLSFQVDEKNIQKVLGTSGEITDIRIAKNHSGKSRGFAYVEFASKASALEVLKRDHETLSGRPMFISPCDPNKDGHQFKYSTGLEKNKLFVKGLNYSTNKEDIEALFSKHGALKDVRLVTHRDGRSKGLAFVEYVKESDAATALVKLDGFPLQGFEISVAISNPPERKKIANDELPSLGGRGTTTKSFTRPKTQMAFVPRSVAITKSSNESNGKTNNGNSNDKSEPVKKSNADFRNMLLKK